MDLLISLFVILVLLSPVLLMVLGFAVEIWWNRQHRDYDCDDLHIPEDD